MLYQTYQGDIEVLIVDGGSTDRTLEIAEAWGAKILETNIRNIALARNILLERASGDVLIFVDSDVILPPYFVELHVNEHQRNPEIDILTNNIVTVTEAPRIEDLRKLPKPEKVYIKPVKKMAEFAQMASSLKRRVTAKVRYDTDFARAHEDGYFFHATLRSGLKIYKALNITVFHYKPVKKLSFIDKVVCSYRNASFPLFLKKFGLWYPRANPGHAIRFLGRFSMMLSLALAPICYQALAISVAYWCIYSIAKKRFDPLWLPCELATMLGEIRFLVRLLRRNFK